MSKCKNEQKRVLVRFDGGEEDTAILKRLINATEKINDFPIKLDLSLSDVIKFIVSKFDSDNEKEIKIIQSESCGDKQKFELFHRGYNLEMRKEFPEWDDVDLDKFKYSITPTLRPKDYERYFKTALNDCLGGEEVNHV